MALNDTFKEMVDCDVTLYVGPHALKGSIGETDCDEVVVLHTPDGVASFRVEHVSGYIYHPFVEEPPKQ